MKIQSTSSPNRMISFDILRGLLLCIIMVDHLQRFPGIYEYITGKGYLWSSAAEAFFILSGLMAGFIYVRRNQSKPFGTTWHKLWRRAGILYLWSIGLTLLYTASAYAMGVPSSIKPGVATDLNLLQLITETLKLNYIYGWADFLAYYAIFLAGAPVIAWLLRRGWAWLAAALSLGVWMTSGSNFILTWQVLFYGGMIVGYYLPELRAFIRGLTPQQRRISGFIVVAVAIGTWLWSSVIITLRNIMEQGAISNIGSLSLDSLYQNDNLLGRHFDKTSLPTLRLLISGLWFGGVLILLRERRTAMFHFFKKACAPLGRHSLFVYILHSFLLFWLDVVVPRTTSRFVNIVLSTAMLVVLWLAVYIVEHWRDSLSAPPFATDTSPKPSL